MALFSCTGAFLGGILFLTSSTVVWEKGLASSGVSEGCDERWMQRQNNIIPRFGSWMNRLSLR